MLCQNQCLWDFENLSICFCGCLKNNPERVFIPWPLYAAGQAVSEFCSSLHLSGWHFEGLLTHTHKNPNNGVLTKEYGYHKCGVLKNEQQINTGDMRLSQPLHVKASRVTQPTKQRPSSMNGNFKKCKSDGHTKKLGNWPSYLLLMIRKCKLNSILL